MDELRRKLSLRLPPDLIDAARDRALEENGTLTRVIESALAEKLGRAPLDTDVRSEVGGLRDRVEALEDFKRQAERQVAI